MHDELQYVMGKEQEQYFNIITHAKGPEGTLPLTHDMLMNAPSGDLFGWSQNVGMGWKPNQLLGKEILLLGTQGGIRSQNGEPIALGYHTGHWEIGLLMEAAAKEVKQMGHIPFSGYVSDPCDGRTQGTSGMFDSLPYRNDAAIVMRRLIRSLPNRAAVIGVATCDKGLPAMMLALSAMRKIPGIIVPGGVTLPPTNGEDAGKIQTIGARYANGELSLEDAADLGCRACATPGGGCQFLGTAGTSQVIAEALGLTVPHAALSPSGQPVWLEMAKQSARASTQLIKKGIVMSDILVDASIKNAMVVHAACGGSTNLLLHIPAIAQAAGLKVPTVEDWAEINRKVPRLVSVLPNGPIPHPTIALYLAGGVPEIMLHLRKLNLLDESVMTVSGVTLKETLDWWETSERRQKVRQMLREHDGIDPDTVIFNPEAARLAGLAPTLTFPIGNIAPEGSVIKSAAIDPSMLDDEGVFRHIGRVKLYTTERAAIRAIKLGSIVAGDIIALVGRGPSGTGMEETYQLTSALKHLSYGKHVTLITDARFSGVSTGACIGHIGPEALAGGPIGQLRDGDWIDVMIDTKNLIGYINMVGCKEAPETVEVGTNVLKTRQMLESIKEDEQLPDDTRLWATLQAVSGGTWSGCVYDSEKIITVLKAGIKALQEANNEKTMI